MGEDRVKKNKFKAKMTEGQLVEYRFIPFLEGLIFELQKRKGVIKYVGQIEILNQIKEHLQKKPTVTTDELHDFAYNWEGLSELLQSRGVKVIE